MSNRFNPVLYSFRRCPYAMRARMVLLLCNQEVELREVLLANKPSQMLEVSPKGTVPVLCLPDSSILDESLEIMRWAIGTSGDPANLFSADSPQHELLDLISLNDTTFKFWLDRYKYHVRYPEESVEFYRGQAEQFLEALESRLNSSAYLFGPRATLADVAIMPFIRQFRGVDTKWFDASPYVSLQGWLNAWLSDPVFISAMVKYPPWQLDDPLVTLSGKQ